MPKTPIRHEIPGDGITNIFAIPWPYIDKKYVKIFLNDVDISDTVTWLSPNTIQVVPTPLSHSTLVITRDTPSDCSLVKFKDGSRLQDADIKQGLSQSLHVMEETLDDITHVTSGFVADTSTAEAAAASAKASAVAASVAADISLTYMGRAEAAALKAEESAGGQYPEVDITVVTEIVDDGESLTGGYDPETGIITIKIPKSFSNDDLVDLNVVTELVGVDENLTGNYDPNTKTLTLKFPQGTAGGSGVELTDRVDLALSTVGASAKAVKMAYDTAVAAYVPLGSTTVPGLIRLATKTEHTNKASGVAAQPSEVDIMIRAILGEASISSPTQDGNVGRGGTYGELWTRLSEHAYGWHPISTMMKDTNLLHRFATQNEVDTGVKDAAQSTQLAPAIGIGEHIASHKITQHLFTSSGPFVPDAGGYLLNLTLIGGGQAGGNGSAAGGTSGKLRKFIEPIPVKKGTSYTVVVGAGGASNGANGGESSFGSYTTSTGCSNTGGKSSLVTTTPGASEGSTIYTRSAATGGLGPTLGWIETGTGGVGGTLGVISSEQPINQLSGGGGGGGWLLPGLSSYTAAASGNGGTTYSGGAGTGLGAGGGGGGRNNTTNYNGGRGAQGGVFFIFIRLPGGLA